MRHLVYMLSVSEYAWGAHLKRFSQLLDSPLKEQVLQQGKEELRHGRILSGTMKTLNLYPRVSRQTKFYLCQDNIYVFNKDETSGFTSPVVGRGKKLKTLRFVLGGKSLEEYSTENRLAFAQVVELMAWTFYSFLSWVAPHPLNAAARAIAQDEAGHKSFLFRELLKRVGTFKACLLCMRWFARFLIISPIALKEFLVSE